MQSYSDWNNNRLYVDHIDRLEKIRSKKVKAPVKESEKIKQKKAN